MAVYRHRYVGYEGERTARWQRFLVLPRYAYRRVFESRFFTIFYVICFLVPLGGLVLIYLRNNLNALAMLQLPAESILAIDSDFFLRMLEIQGSFAFLLTVFVGPGLVSPDLTNNGLPLYLSRPFSRIDYVLGKMLVLLILQSSVTWVPLLLLYLLQSGLAGQEWMLENGRIVLAILIGSMAWNVFLSLLALAFSAWVRWKAVAGALLFGVFLVGAGLGGVVNAVFNTGWGRLFQLQYLMQVTWWWLFHGSWRGFAAGEAGVPIWSAWLMLSLVSAAALILLSRKIRAYEVVR